MGRSITSVAVVLFFLAGCGGSPSGSLEDAGAGTDGSSADAGEDGGVDASASVDGGEDAASGGDSGTVDPYASARQACLEIINQLRATNGKPALTAWTSAWGCTDGEASDDQEADKPHGSFGRCGESGQNLCAGGGAGGLEDCLGAMWDERLQDGCTGCDACADAYREDCPGCDFYGTATGDVCGHYVNMNAEYFTEVSCGFSAQGGWVVMNFR